MPVADQHGDDRTGGGLEGQAPPSQPARSPRGEATASSNHGGNGDSSADKRPVSPPPPVRSRRITSWLMLLLCLLVIAPAVLVELHQPGLLDAQEAAALQTSIQTWNHHLAQESSTLADNAPSWFDRLANRMAPYVDGQPQLDRPPATTWLHELAFLPMGQTPIQSPQQVREATLRARLVSATMALLLIASVYWAGHSIAGVRTAALAALIAAGSVVVIFQARLAGGAMTACAMQMLAMAAALWAMRPLRPTSYGVRRLLGWCLCGLGLSGAVLTAGPAAGPMVTLPLLVIILICPHRVTNLLGILAAHGVGALALAPWAAYVHSVNPAIWTYWLAQLAPEPMTGAEWFELAVHRAWIALLVTAPWTFWLLAAALQPFSASSAGQRRRPMIGWSWFFASLIAVIVLPGPQHPDMQSQDVWSRWSSALASLLLMAPVAAVWLGEMFSRYAELADQGRYPRLWRLLRWAHLFVLLASSLGVASLHFFESQIVGVGWLAPAGWGYWLGLGAALSMMVLLSWRWAWQNRPTQAAVCWSLWVVVLASAALIPAARSPNMQKSAALNPSSLPDLIVQYHIPRHDWPTVRQRAAAFDRRSRP